MNEQINGSGAWSDLNASKVMSKARTINGIEEGLYNRIVAKVRYPKCGKIRINTAP